MKFVESLFSSISKVDLAVLALAAIVATLVNQVVMEATQQHEVVETGLTTVGPVLDVMTVNELVMGAAREAAAAVSGLQRTAHRGWDRAGTATNVEGLTGFVLGDLGPATIAGNPPRCLRGNVGAVFEVAVARKAGSHRIVNPRMNHHLVAVGGRT